MVIDSLNDRDCLAQITKLLPEDAGQMIITTKNREILTDFIEPCKADQCFQVGQLSPVDRREIFNWFNDDLMSDAAGMDELLESLSLPIHVRIEALHLVTRNNPTSDLYQSLKEGTYKYATQTLDF